MEVDINSWKVVEAYESFDNHMELLKSLRTQKNHLNGRNSQFGLEGHTHRQTDGQTLCATNKLLITNYLRNF